MSQPPATPPIPARFYPAGGDAHAAAYVECQVDGRTLWGVGVDADIATASLKAVVSSVNRALRLAAPAGDAELAAV